MNRIWLALPLTLFACGGDESVEEREDVFADQNRRSDIIEAPRVGGITYDFRRPSTVVFNQSQAPIDFDGSSLICPDGNQMPMNEWFDTLEGDWGIDIRETSWFAVTTGEEPDEPTETRERELAARLGTSPECIDCNVCPDGVLVCMNICRPTSPGMPAQSCVARVRPHLGVGSGFSTCTEFQEIWRALEDNPPPMPEPIDPVDPSPEGTDGEDGYGGGGSSGGSSSSGGGSSSSGGTGSGSAGGGGKNGSFSGGGPAGRPNPGGY